MHNIQNSKKHLVIFAKMYYNKEYAILCEFDRKKGIC